MGRPTPGSTRCTERRIAHGHLPYRPGFSMEFPPGAIPPLALPALPGSHYVSWFKAFALVCGLAAIAAVAFALRDAPARRRYGAVVVAAVAPAVLGAISVNSFDLWPAALAAWAVAFVVRGHPRWGLALLGAATAAKLYPALLAPALLAYVAHERGRREMQRALLAGVAVVVAIFLPFAALAPGGLTLQPPGAGDARAPGREPRRLDPRRRAPARRELPRRRHELAVLVRHRRSHRGRARDGATRSSCSRRSAPRGGCSCATEPSTGSGRSAPSRRRRSASSRSRRCSRRSTCSFSCRSCRSSTRSRAWGVFLARARADAGLGALPGSVPPHDAARLRDLGRPRAQRRTRRRSTGSCSWGSVAEARRAARRARRRVGRARRPTT